ncbi:MAG: hypothetical protein OHK0023_00620 [Anaerolineae bacterium]
MPPNIQGKVFAARRIIAQLTIPTAFAVAGPLADRVFEPAMREGGALVNPFGGLVGTGAGAGMALMFLLAGMVTFSVGIGGYLTPVVREAEIRLPDHTA